MATVNKIQIVVTPEARQFLEDLALLEAKFEGLISQNEKTLSLLREYAEDNDRLRARVRVLELEHGNEREIDF